MGTVVTYRAHGILAPMAVRAAARAIAQLEASLSMYAPYSDVSRLNRSVPGEWTAVGSHAALLLGRALYWAAASDGSFDPTTGALSLLWKSHIDGGTVPDPAEVEAAHREVGHRRLSLDEGRRLVSKETTGLRVDLGAIGKGYAADVAAIAFRRHGVHSGLINIGGNVAAIGSAPGGRPWTVGLVDPWHPGRTALALDVRDLSVVTSGTYERYHEQAGVRYHHLLDPRTGYPVPASPVGSVTVVGRDSCDADALATAIFVLGIERGLTLLEVHGRGAQALAIMNGGEVIATAGIRQAISHVSEGFGVAAWDR